MLNLHLFFFHRIHVLTFLPFYAESIGNEQIANTRAALRLNH